MAQPFQGKVVIVTGSSSGIGRAAALLFAKEGASVVVHGSNEQRIQETKKLLAVSGVPSSRILTVQGAMEDESTANALITQTIDTFGRIDVLVNNAGMSNTAGTTDCLSMKHFDQLFAVNLRSAVQLTLLAIPHLEKTQGNVVNVSSISSSMTFCENIFYTMTKAALDHFTRNTATLYASKKIRVNSVLPGVFETNIGVRGGVNGAEYRRRIDPYLAKIPMNRFGDVTEVAQVIRFLASADASYVTGACWAVDGGVLGAGAILCKTPSTDVQTAHQ